MIFKFPKQRISISTLLLVFISCLSSCVSNNENLDNQKKLDINLPDDKEIIVKVEAVSQKNLDYHINLNGKIKSQRDQVFFSELGGYLVDLNIQDGSYCHKGQQLARFDVVQIQNRLKRASLKLFNTQKEYESQLLGYEKLLAGKSETESNNIRQKLRIASGLADAEQEISECKHDLSNASIVAPFSGIISNLKIIKGQMIKPAQELFQIYDPNDLIVEVKLLESDLNLVKINTKAIIKPLAYNSHNYTAHMSKINPYIDENGQALGGLKIDQPLDQKHSNMLFPGMNCNAVINVLLTNSLVIPKTALIIRENRSIAFTLENGRAKWNDVVIGKENGVEVEIKQGLKVGDKVIVSNNSFLANDTPVRLAN